MKENSASRRLRTLPGAMMVDSIAQPDTAALPSRSRTMLVMLYGGLAVGLAFVLLCSVTSGRYQVPFRTVMAILAAHFVEIKPTWTVTEGIVVEVVRLPRVLTAAIAGAGLALCGAVLQGIFRNPLVGPQTIGAASGAALGGVVAILIAGFGPIVQISAFAGAALALLAVLAIHRSDSVSPILTLVLAGVVVSAFCGAMVGLATYVADPIPSFRTSCSGCWEALHPPPGRSFASSRCARRSPRPC